MPFWSTTRPKEGKETGVLLAGFGGGGGESGAMKGIPAAESVERKSHPGNDLSGMALSVSG